MQKIRMVLVFVMGMITSCVVLAASFGSVNANFVRNHDGDTITVNIPGYPPIVGQNMKVRVAGIDTPEIRKPQCEKERIKAYEAKKLVNKLLSQAKNIELTQMRRGKYFRIEANVYFDGKSLKKALLQSGLAIPFKNRKHFSWCKGEKNS